MKTGVRGGRFFMFLFGLPFFLVGLWASWSMLSSLTGWMDMKSWHSVSARVITGGYETRSGENTTYEAHGRYVYEYNGIRYESARVAIDEGADNIGHFHERLGDRLAQAARDGKSIEAFVNPDNPAEAVISRDMRWELFGFKSVFALVFGGAGLGFMIAGARQGRQAPMADAHPDKPWFRNPGWQTNAVLSDSKGAMYFFWGFAAVWCLISAPLPFMLVEEVLEKKNYPALLGLLFPVIGVFLIAKAVQRTLEWRRFGEAAVELNPFPAAIGGQAGGTIELNLPYNPDIKFTVTLTCAYSYETGSGKNRRRSENIKWQDTLTAHTESGIRGTRILFAFDVPEGLPQTDAGEDRGNDYHLWRLHLTADMEGVDPDRTYEIPAYPSREKATHIGERVLGEMRKDVEKKAEESVTAKIAVRHGPYGEEMHYPMGRNIGGALMLAVVGAIFGGAGLFVILHEDMWVMGVIFSLVGIPLFLSGMYMPLNSLSVAADGMGGVLSVRRILGITVKRQAEFLSSIKGIYKSSSFSNSDGQGRQVRHYSVYGDLGGGRKITLGEGFHNEREGEAAIVFIKKKLGVRD